MDVKNLLVRGADYFGNREAVIYNDQRLTYMQVLERSTRLANGLSAMGLMPGDRVAVLEDNCLAAVDAFIGLGLGGFVRAPLYPRNQTSAHVSMMNRANAKALLAGPAFAAEIEGVQEQCTDLEHVLLRNDGYEAWLAEQSTELPEPGLTPDDLFAIRFTGGTTGLPKGVPATHRQFLNQCRDWFYTFPPVLPGDVVLHAAPITHASGTLFLPAWAAGGVNIVIDAFDPVVVLDLIENERVSYMFLPPTAINAIARHPSAPGRDYSSLKVLMSAAAPIANDTALKAHEVFGNVLYQGYGLSEAFPLTMMGPAQWFADIEGSSPLDACGIPLPFTDIQIWNDDCEPVGTGEEGEIVCRTDGQMEGYWQDPEETAKRVIDGWLLTGDVGRLDENGYLYILDRKTDMIISGGFNIYPAEIENVVMSHPEVVEAAAFAIPDKRWGETPMVVAVVADADNVTTQELVDLCVDELGSYKKPGRIIFTPDPLPKTPVGKINRRKLRDLFWGGDGRQVSGA